MWLPGPLYESLPYSYVLAGLLFFGGTWYIGPDAPGTWLYLGSGVFSLIAGIAVFIRRHRYRAAADSNEPMDFTATSVFSA